MLEFPWLLEPIYRPDSPELHSTKSTPSFRSLLESSFFSDGFLAHIVFSPVKAISPVKALL